MKMMFTGVAVLVALFTAAAVAAEAPASRAGTLRLQPEVKSAIDKGLAWVAKAQKADGHWDSGHPTADTSLCLMAFLLQGHVPGRGTYGQNMDRAISWLISKAEKQGGYLGDSTTGGGMYEHGLGVLALSELWGQSKNPEIRDTLKRAVAITLRAQHPEGGWRYTPKPEPGDMSMTGMHIVALNSAKDAGIYIPDATFQRAMKFVASCQDPKSGGYTYTPNNGKGGDPGIARTGAAVLSMMLSGERESPAVKYGMRFLRAAPDTKFTSEGNLLYTHYYAIQCMYQSGDEPFADWYPRISEVLLGKQLADGSWSVENGNTYSTAMAILILGVPYRYLPIYQR